MRKIEKKMVEALLTHTHFKSGNTEVAYNGLAWVVYLFGHQIFTLYASTSAASFSICGWPTATTRSRLNALFDGLYEAGVLCTRYSITQRGGKQRLTALHEDMDFVSEVEVDPQDAFSLSTTQNEKAA